MLTTLASIVLYVFIFTYTTPVAAANNSDGGQHSGTSQQAAVSNQGMTQQIQSQTQTQVQTQTMTGSPTGMQVQNQNQIQTQNQGENQSLQVTTQESLSIQKGNNQSASGSQSVLKSIEDATKNTEDILNVSMVKGSPGEKIQEIVKSQAVAQTEIATETQKLDSRKGFIKTIIGPDFKAIKILTQQMEQNQLRITELDQLKNQLVNQSDIVMVQEIIQALIDQNTALQNKVISEEKTGSMFGWLLKFFVQ